MKRYIGTSITFSLLLLVSSPRSTAATPLGTAFIYQGRLNDGNSPARGNYDLTFTLYGTLTNDTAVAGRLTNAVAISNGVFTVALDFGQGVFTGNALWLEVGVRTNGAGADFTILGPRQPVGPAPYAAYAPRAGTASTASSIVNGAVSAPQLNTLGAPASGQVLGYNGTSLDWMNASAAGNAWVIGGNSATTPGTDFLGTVDNRAMEMKVNGVRALRLEPNASGAPNVVAGAPVNSALGVGATISGGGAVNYLGFAYSNRVTDDFGTIGGGFGNTSGHYATVSGGWQNTSSGNSATVGGGGGNTSSDDFATVGGGLFNMGSGGRAATVSGGEGNRSSQSWATVGGGAGNTSSGSSATVGGGAGNTSSGISATVGGGTGNNASGLLATVGGGIGNASSADYGTVSGGYSNLSSAVSATVGGGFENVSSGDSTTVSGGYQNVSSGGFATVGGGFGNGSTTTTTTVGGGYYNTSSGESATVGGGSFNTSSASAGTVGGGEGNKSSGRWATVGGGYGNTSSNMFATVPGGVGNIAGGQYSFAAGLRAQALHDGAVVWADSSGVIFPTAFLTSTNPNSWTVQASGGVRFFSDTNATVGAYLPPGGNGFSPMSDRNVKENFKRVDPRAVLEKLSRLPVTEWNLISQPASIRHIGPMAQDFQAAFGVGEDNRHISTSDADGVALAAIQGLNQKLEELVKRKEARIQTLEHDVTELKAMVNLLLKH